MKKVLIVTCLFDPEPVVSARLALDLANKFVDLGCRPVVLCPKPSRPLNKNYDGFKFNVYKFPVHRLDSYRAPQYSISSRIRESYSFGKASANWLAKNPDFDAVYINTWPIFGQHFVLKQTKALNIQSLLHIQDLYPESFVERLPSIFKIFVKPFFNFEKRMAHSASHIISISQNMMEYYQQSRALKKENMTLVSNWQDEQVYLEKSVKKGYEEIGGPDKFVFMFLGNIGPVAGVELLINAFSKIEKEKVQLVIAGDGTQRTACEALTKSLNAKNVIFSSVPFEDTGYVLSLSDVCLLPIKKGHGISSIPSKLIGYLFAQKPILISADLDCDSARVVQSGECGWAIEPEDETEMHKAFLDIMDTSTDALNKLGANGSQLARDNFSKETGSTRLAETILSIANQKDAKIKSTYS